MKDADRQELIKKHLEAFKYIGRPAFASRRWVLGADSRPTDVLVNNASKQIQCADLAEIDMDNVGEQERSATAIERSLIPSSRREHFPVQHRRHDRCRQ